MIKKVKGFVAAVLLSFSLAGCNSGIEFNLSYNARGGFGYKEENGSVVVDVLKLVRSLQELKDLCVEWNNPSFDENSLSFLSEFSQKIRSYDEDYFNNKILIIYSFDRGHRIETKITGITVGGEHLTINARHKTKRVTFTDESFNWLILIEVSKTDILEATTVQILYK